MITIISDVNITYFNHVSLTQAQRRVKSLFYTHGRTLKYSTLIVEWLSPCSKFYCFFGMRREVTV